MSKPIKVVVIVVVDLKNYLHICCVVGRDDVSVQIQEQKTSIVATGTFKRSVPTLMGESMNTHNFPTQVLYI